MSKYLLYTVEFFTCFVFHCAKCMYNAGPAEIVHGGAHWTYFMQILSNYNTKSLYHIVNLVIKALKSDIFHSYTCEINIGDIWLQFEKLKKLRQMGL